MDSENQLWAATNQGLVKYDQTNFFNFRVGNSGLANNQILSVSVDMNENLWMGTAGGGLSIFNENGLVLSDNSSEILEANTKIFPNPATNKVSIHLNWTGMEINELEIQLFDNNGRLIKQVKPNKLEVANGFDINTSTLASGLYFCHLNNGGTQIVKKLVVAH